MVLKKEREGRRRKEKWKEGKMEGRERKKGKGEETMLDSFTSTCQQTRVIWEGGKMPQQTGLWCIVLTDDWCVCVLGGEQLTVDKTSLMWSWVL